MPFKRIAFAAVAAVALSGMAGTALASSIDFDRANALEYFSIDPDSDFTFANIEVALSPIDFSADGAFSGLTTSADIAHTANVPEPAELGLFGLGMALLLTGVARRRAANRLR